MKRFVSRRFSVGLTLRNSSQESAKKYITAPIFYVNASPHIGHLYSTVLGDTLCRWYKLKKYPSFFSVGTDEHGLKVQQAAQSAKMDPQSFCDMVSIKFKKLFESASIEPSDFIRTSESRHHKVVHHFWNEIEQAGYIYKGFHEGWYSVSDETFVPESQIEDVIRDGISIKVSKESGKVVEWTKEENYKFKLSAFKERLLDWLLKNPKVIVPSNQYKDILNQLKENELGDLSISRLKSKVSWGISVPNDDHHVIYVWLDALTNYLTVTGYPFDNQNPAIQKKTHPSLALMNNDNQSTRNHLPDWPASWHIVGRDIIKFHAIYWPAFLMAANLPLPKKILSHGHWLVGNQKMSKSSGNGVDANQVLEKYGIDAIRYFLLRDGGISINPEFSMDTIMRRYKHDLAGQLGNLAMRATSLKINPTGNVPDSLATTASKEESEIMETCLHLRDKVDHFIEQGLFSDALASISDLIGSVNRYWSQIEPWHYDRSIKENQEKLQNIFYVSCEALRISGILLQPVMPSISSKLLDTLLVDKQERFFEHAILDASIRKNRTIQPATILFPKLK